MIAYYKKEQSDYEHALIVFSKISILSNIIDKSQYIYMIYKQRG